MATRIRYSYTKEPLVLVSKQFFIHPKDGSKYKVELNEGDKTFKIIEDLSEAVAAEGKGANMHQVKKNAKAMLESLGISFEDENRKVKLTV